jgi:hypothetical protein
VIDRVVVDEGGEVDQLHDRRECLGFGSRSFAHFITQEKQARPEELPPDLEKVVVDLGQPIKIASDDPAKLIHDPIEPIRDRALDLREFRGYGTEHLILKGAKEWGRGGS